MADYRIKADYTLGVTIPAHFQPPPYLLYSAFELLLHFAQKPDLFLRSKVIQKLKRLAMGILDMKDRTPQEN